MVTLLYLLVSSHVVHLRKFVARAFGRSRWQFDPFTASRPLAASYPLTASCPLTASYPLAASHPLTVPYPLTAFSFAPTRRFHGQSTSAEGDGMLVSHPRGGRSLIPPMYVVELRHALMRDSVPCAPRPSVINILASPAWIVGCMLESSDVYSDRRAYTRTVICTYTRIAVRLQLITTALQLLSRCFVMRRE